MNTREYTRNLGGGFISQQLDSITEYNHQDPLSGTSHHGATASLSTGNIIGIKPDPIDTLKSLSDGNENALDPK